MQSAISGNVASAPAESAGKPGCDATLMTSESGSGPVNPEQDASERSFATVTVTFVSAAATSKAPHAKTVRAAPTAPPRRFRTSAAVMEGESPFSTTT